MSMALPPLFAIFFAAVGYVAGTVTAMITAAPVYLPEVAAVLGGTAGFVMWLASDAPVTTGGMGM